MLEEERASLHFPTSATTQTDVNHLFVSVYEPETILALHWIDSVTRK